MTIRPRQTCLQPAVTMCGDGELWEFSFYRDAAQATSQTRSRASE